MTRLSICQLEELSLNAWPALQTLCYDGWLLRFAAGYTRRANSVNPLYASSEDLQRQIAYCEYVYTAAGQDTVFKLTPASQPSTLDTVLAEAGYRREAPTNVLTMNLSALSVTPSQAFFSTASHLTDRWLTACCQLNQVDARHIPTMTRMLENIVPARCFAALEQAGEITAVGLGVYERGYVGLFDIVTALPLRNQGLGRQLVHDLLGWGRSQGAHFGYLQVMHSNAPALHLYASIGFREAYTYWYRVKTRGKS